MKTITPQMRLTLQELARRNGSTLTWDRLPPRATNQLAVMGLVIHSDSLCGQVATLTEEGWKESRKPL